MSVPAIKVIKSRQGLKTKLPELAHLQFGIKYQNKNKTHTYSKKPSSIFKRIQNGEQLL